MSYTFLAVTLLDRFAVGSVLQPIIMYIGPGVAVPVLTGLAAVLGFVLLMWDKGVHVVRKLLRFVRPIDPSPSSKDEA